MVKWCWSNSLGLCTSVKDSEDDDDHNDDNYHHDGHDDDHDDYDDKDVIVASWKIQW